MYVWGEPSQCDDHTDISHNVFQGTLNGESPALFSEGFAVKYKSAHEPHKLLLPNPIRAVRCVYAYICNKSLAF